MIVELPKSTTSLHQPQSSRGLLPPQVLYSCMSSSADLTRAFFWQNFQNDYNLKSKRSPNGLLSSSFFKYWVLGEAGDWSLHAWVLSSIKQDKFQGAKRSHKKTHHMGVLGPTYSWQKDQQLCFPAYYYTNTCIIADLEDPVSEIL